jgi:hypothetical protein
LKLAPRFNGRLRGMISQNQMAKRAATNTKNKASRSKKTKKRLEIKRLMLLAKSAKGNRRRRAVVV